MRVDLDEFLKEKFQLQEFRKGQREVITSVLKGEHTVAMLPTGTGKSLCYQFPGYLLKGQVIIVSPLLSLMQDQVEQLKIRGEKNVAAINSFLTPSEKRVILSSLDRYKFLFISPEMLHVEGILNRLKKLSIALFVIDEAHCISQWGYDFRPDYMKLGQIRDALGNPLTLSLTATATRTVIDDIINSLRLESWQEHIYSVDRANIAMKVERFSDFTKKKQRLFELTDSLCGPGIIYFSSRKLAEEITAELKERGMQGVEAYHGNMDQESRILIQQQFIQGQLQCICATSAFGMGINKENVRYIIHFHLPLQVESYLQEIGRAGRDGKRSIAILLYSPGDDQLSGQLLENELPDKEQISALARYLALFPEAARNLKKYENEVCDATGLTETQWRVTEDFLQSHHSHEIETTMAELAAFTGERRQYKLKKLQQMKVFIVSGSCRREKILNYFGDEKKMEIDNCCDLCGIEMEHFQGKSPNIKGDSPVFDWRAHLAAILLES